MHTLVLVVVNRVYVCVLRLYYDERTSRGRGFVGVEGFEGVLEQPVQYKYKVYNVPAPIKVSYVSL